MLKTATFAIGVWGNLFARFGSGAMPFLTPLFLQLGLGFSPSKAGMTMIPTVRHDRQLLLYRQPDSL